MTRNQFGVDEEAAQQKAEEKADQEVLNSYPGEMLKSQEAQRLWLRIFDREFRRMAYP